MEPVSRCAFMIMFRIFRITTICSCNKIVEYSASCWIIDGECVDRIALSKCSVCFKLNLTKNVVQVVLTFFLLLLSLLLRLHSGQFECIIQGELGKNWISFWTLLRKPGFRLLPQRTSGHREPNFFLGSPSRFLLAHYWTAAVRNE